MTTDTVNAISAGPEAQRARQAEWDAALAAARAVYVDRLYYPHYASGWCGACGEGWALDGGVHCAECGCTHTRVLPPGPSAIGAGDPDPAARLASARPDVRARIRGRRIRRLAETIQDGLGHPHHPAIERATT